jgi:hypothetical protein
LYVGGGGHLLHWDGQQFESIDVGAPLGDFASISGSGPDDVWISADNGTDFSGSSVVAHFDGRHWSREDGNPNGYGESIVSGSSPDDVWMFDIGSVERFDGREWISGQKPSPIMQTPGYIGVPAGYEYPSYAWVGGVNDVWVPGEQVGAIVQHYGCGRWVTQQLQPNADTSGSAVIAVYGIDSDDVWAVGGFRDEFGAGGAERSIALHWNGTAWTNVRTPAPATIARTAQWTPASAMLSSVHASSRTNVWAVAQDGTVLRLEPDSIEPPM